MNSKSLCINHDSSGCNQTTTNAVVGTGGIQGSGGVQGTGGIASSPVTQTGSGGVMTSLCTTVDVNEITQEDLINIYPNPSNGIFSIQSSEKISAIEIINVLGEKIYSLDPSTSLRVTNQKAEINLSKQPKGIYFIKINSENEITTRKIIIE